jgi:ubiquinone biosynthesis protein
MNGKLILGKRVRHLGRYKTVAHILIRNGFGWFIDEIGLTRLLTLPKRLWRDNEKKEMLTTSERIRITLEQLGPTFVKIGQIASLRTDLLPIELTDQLTRLQDDVPPLEFDPVRHIVESELGGELEDIFLEFDQSPIGSASIGQVHRAVLQSGEVVAVKVQRPEIQRNIEIDFEILADIARLAERRFQWAEHYELTSVVEEFRNTLLNELNYIIEGQNAERIRKTLNQTMTVYIPQIHWDFTTSKILVMEFVKGVKLNEYDTLDANGFNKKLLAARASKAVFTQILIHGFFHADPHPGNLAALPGDVILFMDFGMVGRLTPELKSHLAGLIIGLMRRNTDLIIRALYRMGVVPPDIDDDKLHKDIDLLRDKYYDIPLSQVHLGESVSDIFSVAYKHRIKIPADLSLVGKTLLTIEGVVTKLDPDFRIMDIALPFGKRLLKNQFKPRTVTRNMFGSVLDLADFAADLPRQVRHVLQEVKRERIKAELSIPEIHGILSKLDRSSNRISFSVVVLALSIFMAGVMVASSIRPTLAIWRVPLMEFGLIFSAIMVALLIWSIFRSGRM